MNLDMNNNHLFQGKYVQHKTHPLPRKEKPFIFEPLKKQHILERHALEGAGTEAAASSQPASQNISLTNA